MEETHIMTNAYNFNFRLTPIPVILGQAYRRLIGGFLLLRIFSVAISESPHVCLRW